FEELHRRCGLHGCRHRRRRGLRAGSVESTWLAASMQGWQGVGCALGTGVLWATGMGSSFLSDGVGIGLGGGAKWVTGTSGIAALLLHRCGQKKPPTITIALKPVPIFASRELIFTPGVFVIAVLAGQERIAESFCRPVAAPRRWFP